MVGYITQEIELHEFGYAFDRVKHLYVSCFRNCFRSYFVSRVFASTGQGMRPEEVV